MTNQQTISQPSSPDPCKLATELIRHASVLLGEIKMGRPENRSRYDDLQDEIARLNRANTAMKQRLDVPAAPADNT